MILSFLMAYQPIPLRLKHGKPVVERNNRIPRVHVKYWYDRTKLAVSP